MREKIIQIDPELIQILKLAEKNIKIATIILFHISPSRKEE